MSETRPLQGSGTYVIDSDLPRAKPLVSSKREPPLQGVPAQAADGEGVEYLTLLSHELRDALMALMGAAQLLAETDSSRTTKAHALRVLRRQAARMTSMLDATLDVSLIKDGKRDLKRTPLDLQALSEEVLAEAVTTFAKEGVVLEWKPGPDPVPVLGDDVRIIQALDAVLTHALRATAPPGNVSVSVRRSVGRRSVGHRSVGHRSVGHAVVSIVLRSSLQTRPETAPLARARQECDPSRSGLGLAVAGALLKAHGGELVARTSEFELRLPLHHGTETARTPSTQQSGLRLLVVEDNEDAAEMLRDLLQLCGHAVQLTKYGQEALDVLRRDGADLVLCDLELPDMSGLEVARTVRADAKLAATPLLAMSGSGSPGDLARSVAAGFDVHLTKPVEYRSLTPVIERLARSR